jgi:hypothetical protein
LSKWKPHIKEYAGKIMFVKRNVSVIKFNKSIQGMGVSSEFKIKVDLKFNPLKKMGQPYLIEEIPKNLARDIFFVEYASNEDFDVIILKKDPVIQFIPKKIQLSEKDSLALTYFILPEGNKVNETNLAEFSKSSVKIIPDYILADGVCSADLGESMESVDCKPTTIDIIKEKVDQIKEYWEIILVVISLLTGGYFFIRKRTVGVVKVRRGVEREGGLFKIGIKVLNESTFVISDVKVRLGAPEALNFVAPETDTFELGSIAPGEFQTAIYKLEPTRCVDGSISGIVEYRDSSGKIRTTGIRKLAISSICPFIKPIHLTSEEFDEKARSLLSLSQVIKTRLSPKKIRNALQARLSAFATISEEFFAGEGIGKYFGAGKYSGEQLGVILEIEEGKLKIVAFGSNKSMLTGIISECDELIKKAEG